MSKALSIALAVLIVTFLVPPAQAQTTPAPLSPIEKQEIGRRNDPRLFNTGQVTPVEVVGPSDSFDYADAGVGGALALSAAAVAGAFLVVGHGRRRRRSPGIAPSSS